jgi:hypothetical protein
MIIIEIIIIELIYLFQVEIGSEGDAPVRNRLIFNCTQHAIKIRDRPTAQSQSYVDLSRLSPHRIQVYLQWGNHGADARLGVDQVAGFVLDLENFDFVLEIVFQFPNNPRIGDLLVDCCLRQS